MDRRISSVFWRIWVFIHGFITLQLHHDATGRMVRHDDTERTLKWSFSNLSVVLSLCRRCCKQFFVPVWLINGFFLPKSDREIVISSIISVSIERPESFQEHYSHTTAAVWNYTLYIGFIHIAHVSTEFLHESFLDKEAFIMSSLGHLIQRKD